LRPPPIRPETSLAAVLIRTLAAIILLTTCQLAYPVGLEGTTADWVAVTPERFEGAPPGVVERGAPAYSFQAFEQLGLQSLPTDLTLLPDGRALVFGPRELAIGDGVRWEVLQADFEGSARVAGEVIVDEAGEIYTGVSGGMARVRFSDGAKWKLERVEEAIPATAAARPMLQPMPVGDEWLWHTAAGPVFRWKPGVKSEQIGFVGDVQQILRLDGVYVYKKWGDAGLFALADNRPYSRRLNETETTRDLLALAALSGNEALGITTSGQLYRHDAGGWSRVTTAPPLETRRNLSASAAVGDAHVALGFDGQGVVFYDRQGREVQSIDRRIDSRLGRITKIVAGKNGIVWLLLNDGVARVEFPSPLSHLDVLVPTGLTLGEPIRVGGNLWVHANGGSLHRAEYNTNGILTGFVEDGPDGARVFTLSIANGVPFASTDKGFFVHEGLSWKMAAPGVANGRIIASTQNGARLAYAARDELGWLVRNPDGSYAKEDVTVGSFGDVWASVMERPGVQWLEVGSGRPALADWTGRRPTIQVFDQREGLPAGWAQVFHLDGRIRFLISAKCYIYSPTEGRFVPDPDVPIDKSWLQGAMGRPARDALGRVWVARDGSTQILDTTSSQHPTVVHRFPPGIQPFFFRMESDGVVWLEQRRRLMRFDPSVPMPTVEPLRALVTQVEFTGERRTFYGPLAALDPIPFSLNSFTVRFQAPGNPLNLPASFQFRLEGGDDKWVSVGVTGTAVLNELSEGSYVLHVRPVLGGVPETESTLPFVILPPWYRHPFAYLAYAISAIAIVSLVGLYSTWSQRREKAHLENVIAERTHAVREANEHLGRQVQETTAKSRELQASEERYRTLYDHNPAMFFTLDVTGRVLSVNQYGAEQLGYMVKELVGSRWADLVHEEDRAEAGRSIRESVAHPGRLVASQVRAQRKTGQVVFIKEVLRAIPQSQQGLVVFVVCEDVTAHVQLEAQLRQAQKMEAVGQLAGGVAHDFNNLLTIIQGQAEWAETHATTAEEKQECIREVRRAAEQAGKLTRQLLVFSRQQAMHAESVDLNELVTKVVKLMQRVLGEDIQVHTRAAPAPAQACVDTAMIEQVLVNLGLNARDAMPSGGQITITVHSEEVDEARIAGRAGCRPGPHHCIRFSDTGVGIPVALLNRIFEPFFTTKAPGQGTGLGLATSSSIVSQHHGWIEVESTPGFGTTFSVFLPTQVAGAGGASAVAAQALPAVAGAQRVLLVEDEPAVRRVAQRMLERSGFTVVEAENADQALGIWERSGGDFDILLTDLLMPGSMNGRALAEMLSSRSSRLRVCLMSGHDPEVLARKSGQPGPMRPHLIKPFTRDSLIAAVNRSVPTKA
jgi:PAS domain S-box-containing protein